MPVRLPGADRALPGHPRPVRPDPVRAHAQAARRGARRATTCRHCRWSMHAAAPCPVDGQAADDRLVGPDHQRVLRAAARASGCYAIDTEQWLAPSRFGRTADGGQCPHPRRGRRRATGGRGRADLVRRRRSGSSTTTIPAKTAGAYNERGWGTLGDIGYVDDDGFLYLTDRVSHMIISGGVNIYPQEVENELTMHPAVTDVAVIGVPNSDLGEEVKAIVVPGRSGGRRRRTGDGADRVLPLQAGPLQVPGDGRLRRRAAAAAERQAAQARVAATSTGRATREEIDDERAEARAQDRDDHR